MSKVSVIIPVYNVENYLAFCLDSVISQTYSDLEIICVNDGSTDSSLHILEKYALFDKRIKIINKENGGLSSARNAGFKLSKGEFVTFIDSDDFISPLMIENLHTKIVKTQADFIYCNVIWYNTRKKQYFSVQKGVTPELEAKFPQGFFKENEIEAELYFDIPCAVYNKLYRSNFLIENNIIFPEGLIFEDVSFYSEIYLKADKIAFDKNHYTVYRAHREGSIVQSGGENYFDAFKILKISKNLFISTGKWEKYKTNWLLYEIKVFFVDLFKIREDLKKKFYNSIKKYYKNLNFDDYDVDKLKNEPIYPFFETLLANNFEDFNVSKEEMFKVV